MVKSRNSKEVVACATCIGDKYLASAIREGSAARSCSFCGSDAQVVDLPTLGLAADKALVSVARKVTLFADPIDVAAGVEYESDGRPFAELIRANLSGSADGLPEALAKQLLGLGKQRKAIKEQPAWSVRERYVASALPLSTTELDKQWNKYLGIVTGGSRFFNEDARRFLDGLFKDADRLKVRGLFKDQGPLLELKENKQIFRARQVEVSTNVDDLLADPESQLGAPGPSSARAGRMNPERSPVFYGATEEATAVAELRPPIGGDVVVARFRLTRPLKVFDFTTLERTSGATISIWNPEFKQRALMRALLWRLHDRVRRPVRPGAEHEYLSTQVMAEYLSIYKDAEGLMFGSAQHGGGKNLVVFGRALGTYNKKHKRFDGSPLVLDGPPRIVRITRVDYAYDPIKSTKA